MADLVYNVIWWLSSHFHWLMDFLFFLLALYKSSKHQSVAMNTAKIFSIIIISSRIWYIQFFFYSYTILTLRLASQNIAHVCWYNEIVLEGMMNRFINNGSCFVARLWCWPCLSSSSFSFNLREISRKRVLFFTANKMEKAWPWRYISTFLNFLHYGSRFLNNAE